MLLIACYNRSNPYFGKWQFTQMEVNGFPIDTMMLKDAFLELKQSGIYKQNLFAATESGIFAINQDTLKLHCKSNPNIANKYFLITIADSAHLVLTSDANGNQLKILLSKI